MARFLVAVAGRPAPDQRVLVVELNGGPAIVVHSGATAIAAVFLDIANGAVERIYLVAKPGEAEAAQRARQLKGMSRPRWSPTG